MGIIITNRARTLYAARDAGQRSGVTIDSIQIGNTVAYDPDPAATALMDPTPNVIDMDGFDTTAAEPVVQLTTELNVDVAITGKEIGFFAGNELIFLWSDAGRNAFVKPEGEQAIITLLYSYEGQGTPTNLTPTVTITALVKASTTDAQTGTDDNKFMTALKTAQAILHLLTNSATTYLPFANKNQAEAGSSESVIMSPKRVEEHWRHKITVSANDPPSNTSGYSENDLWGKIE